MSEEAQTREEVYDSRIAPLMAQIIAICKANKIPMIANYNLDHDGDGLQCTTYIWDDGWLPTDGMMAAYEAMKPRMHRTTMVATRDGSGKITRLDAVVG